MKIKNWLIKKLGGYVEPPIRQVKIEQVVMKPTTINVSVRGDADFLKARMMREACREISYHLYTHQELLQTKVIKDSGWVTDEIHVSLRVLQPMEEDNE